MSVFTQSLSVGSGAPEGANVQIGSCHSPESDWVVIKCPNKSWICTLDCTEWKLWATTPAEGIRHNFRLQLNNPDRVVLEPDGTIYIVNQDGSPLWQRGPFGASSSYELRCEDEGDMVLYNGDGSIVWRAVGDIPNPPGF